MRLERIGEATERMIPSGWSWCLYGPTETHKARAVLVSPDYRTHIGREAASIDEALAVAARDAAGGARQ
jgi:hypothetical protein